MTFPANLSLLVKDGSMRVPKAMRPPGTANCNSFCSSTLMLVILVLIGWHLTTFWFSYIILPGLISIMSPTLRTPSSMHPPTTPPAKFSMDVPGLLMSNERMIINLGGTFRIRLGTGIQFTIYSKTKSIFIPLCAEIGTIGEFSAILYLVKSLILACCSIASSFFTKSILFWMIVIYFIFIISIADKCSQVWGWGHYSLAATSNKHASIIAAPFNIVAIRISCPGQSTKLMCLFNIIGEPHSSQIASSSFFADPNDL